MDEIIADVDDPELRLPAEPRADSLKNCKACAVQNCSKQRIECQKDKKCRKLLKSKSNYGNPNDLLSNFDDETDDKDEAIRKYRDYFTCVFLYGKEENIILYDYDEEVQVNGCRSECGGGETFSCNKESQPKTQPDTIKLTIHINQIKDMFIERKMVSPGEHCVCIQWAENTADEKVCEDEDKKRCEDGDMTEPISNTMSYTNGLGTAFLSVDYGVTGYLRIERGDYYASGHLSFDDLGPFIYYLGRSLTKDQEITLYLPQRVQEVNWAKPVDPNWSFTNGSMITVLAYDCLVTPARRVSFTLPQLEDNVYHKVYWNQNLDSSLIKFSAIIDPYTVPGISSFLISSSLFKDKEEVDVKIEANRTDDPPFQKDEEIKVRKNFATFIALYPEAGW